MDPAAFDPPKVGTTVTTGVGGGGGARAATGSGSSATGSLPDAGSPSSNGGGGGSGEAGGRADAFVGDAIDAPSAVVDASRDVVSCPDCPLRVQYRCGDTNATDNQFKPQLNVVNAGLGSVQLSELTVRYWFSEGTTAEMFICDYAMIGQTNVTGRFEALATPRALADHFLEIGFLASAGSLAGSSATGEIQGRCQKSDYSPYNEADDYSFDPSAAAYADAPRVTLYRQGVLVWGTEP